ncbi:DUF4850 domain-containing protein [Paenibacillus pabuli]|uniref:DUF4850 domain-containing protein n=1 Tax=Paenibacillus pabuli TaxID=1472 RepID=UPI00324288EC
MEKNVEQRPSAKPRRRRIGWFTAIAVVPLLTCGMHIGFSTWGNGYASAPALGGIPQDSAPVQSTGKTIVFPGNDGSKIALPLQLTEADLSMDSDRSYIRSAPPRIPEMSYELSPELKEKLQAVLVYRPDMQGGYLLLAPAGWKASGSVGANGSYGLTLTNPDNIAENLHYSDNAWACQGCAINNIGTYFPDQADWADEQGFTVYEPMAFDQWNDVGSEGDNHRTALYVTTSKDGFYQKGVGYYAEDINGYLFRLLEYNLAQVSSIEDEVIQSSLHFFQSHHGPMNMETD